MPSLGMQLQRTLQGKIEVNSPVLFNQTILKDDDNIEYSEGTFRFKAYGRYYVSWFVSLKSALGIFGPEFAITTNEDPAVCYSASSGMKTTQVSGFALLEVKKDFSFQLLNISEGEACFSDNTDVTAGIAVLNVTPMEKGRQSIGGIQLQLHGLNGIDIANLMPIPFDTELKNLSGNITNLSGNIEIRKAGRYLVDWWVGISGASSVENIRFSLINRLDSSVLGESVSPVVLPNVFYGNAIIDINNTPANISLFNNSGASLTFSAINKQAGIRIVELVGD